MVQEVKKLLRARIQQELGSVPNALYEKLWQVRERNLRELAEEDVCEADVLEGDVGTDYVDVMRFMLEGWQVAQSASAPAYRVPLRASTPPVGDVIERMWSVLPERDKQAMEQVWQFTYNRLEPRAQKFRERYTEGRTLTQSEAYEWVTAEENGCRDVLFVLPYKKYELYEVQMNDLDVDVLVMMLDSWDVIVWVLPGSPIAELASFASLNERFYGLPLQVIVRFVLTGERLPPRIPILYLAGLPTPLFPAYLSAEGVEKVWKTVHYTGNARSWTLARYELNEFSSYEDARRHWNEVVPAEWRIGDYRTFRRLWLRAGKGTRRGARPKEDPFEDFEDEEAGTP